MKILLHPAHTSSDGQLASTGYDFHLPMGAWDSTQRPLPGNFHLNANMQEKYDLIIVGHEEGFHALRNRSEPMIFRQSLNLGGGNYPTEIERRVKAVVFTVPETSRQWKLEDEQKKVVIKHAVDHIMFSRYAVEAPLDVVCSANCIPSRPELNRHFLDGLAKKVRLEVVGAGNEALGYSSGPSKDLEDLVERMRRYKVYFNSCKVIGLSTLEAMSIGLPVVTVRPTHFTDLIVNGKNGFVVDTVPEAAARVEQLLKDPALRMAIGQSGRESVIRQFSEEEFKMRWTHLIEATSRTHGDGIVMTEDICGWGSHYPVLAAMVQRTKGPVIELGMGHYSTPLLHLMCSPSRLQPARRLLSVDTNAKWSHKFGYLETEWHALRHVTVEHLDAFAPILADRWSVAFIDHAPEERRAVDLARLARHADFIVVHDTDHPAYKYEPVLEKFKYRFDYKSYPPWTSVVSMSCEVPL